jgi:hypothetical protein
MEIRPDHGWEKVSQGAPPGRGARGGSEPRLASHDPHDAHHRILGAPHGHPHPRSARVKASRPLICVLVINDNHYGLTFLFEL